MLLKIIGDLNEKHFLKFSVITLIVLNTEIYLAFILFSFYMASTFSLY